MAIQRESSNYSWDWMDDRDSSPPRGTSAKRLRTSNSFYNETYVDDLEEKDLEKSKKIFRKAFVKGSNLVWVVEKVLQKRVTTDGRIEYKIKWEGFGNKHNTWEPRQNVEGLSLVKLFEDKLESETCDGKSGLGLKEVSYRDAIKENVWPMEKILSKRTKYGKNQYLVKWEGYSDANNSWEPEDRVKDSKPFRSFEENELKKADAKKSEKLYSHITGEHPSFGSDTNTNASDDINSDIEDVPASDPSWEDHVSMAIENVEKGSTNTALIMKCNEVSELLDNLSNELNNDVHRFGFSEKKSTDKTTKDKFTGIGKIEKELTDTIGKEISSNETKDDINQDEKEDEPDEMYIVEKVLAKRITKKKGVEYKIKWKGFENKYNSWEPKENVEGIALVKLFEEKSGQGRKSLGGTTYDDAIKESLWEIEHILDRRFNSGKLEYLVKWSGYSDHYNSWEGEKMVKHLDVFRQYEEQQQKGVSPRKGKKALNAVTGEAKKSGSCKIEKIIEKRFQAGKIEYLVKWEGFSDQNNSWEEEVTVKHLDVVKHFEAQQGRKH